MKGRKEGGVVYNIRRVTFQQRGIYLYFIWFMTANQEPPHWKSFSMGFSIQQQIPLEREYKALTISYSFARMYISLL